MSTLLSGPAGYALVMAIAGLLTAVAGWLKASTNSKVLAALTVSSAVHEAKLDGLFKGQVQAVMAPSMAEAAAVARHDAATPKAGGTQP